MGLIELFPSLYLLLFGTDNPSSIVSHHQQEEIGNTHGSGPKALLTKGSRLVQPNR
ncbi:hypothetical protein SAMN02745781_00596 [Vibrio gazogenes DSM 21264]|uniref:Uncharacterized protein n=1 Tax=Vibrio gazogenes DSM 21264 = NBRC 103151 TaxID=1123492 RepID=A0A1M4UYF0_VIBGA|nr:hypothetical protein SAMN02745781_00596 [Vibrio gazogenes DSM 21264] [Vibrio gazogenes DSM 21264 = NBRC 103151]SJN58100.1 hypothetical protein BQ6471_02872 [Vibrio gazogenes]